MEKIYPMLGNPSAKLSDGRKRLALAREHLKQGVFSTLGSIGALLNADAELTDAEGIAEKLSWGPSIPLRVRLELAYRLRMRGSPPHR
jgi:hypothetical protein